jgi:hypothetical protein
MLQVAYLANRRATLPTNLPQLARGKPEQDVAALLGHDLSIGARRTTKLSAMSDLHLDVVNPGTQRHSEKLHGVTRLDVRLV